MKKTNELWLIDPSDIRYDVESDNRFPKKFRPTRVTLNRVSLWRARRARFSRAEAESLPSGHVAINKLKKAFNIRR